MAVYEARMVRKLSLNGDGLKRLSTLESLVSDMRWLSASHCTICRQLLKDQACDAAVGDSRMKAPEITV